MDTLSQEKLNLIFNTMQEGVVEEDPDGKIIAWNPAALKILNLSKEEIQGRSNSDPKWSAIKLDGTEYPVEEMPAQIAITTGKSQHGKIMGLNYFDGIRWIQINAVPFEVDIGTRHAIVTFIDITDLIHKAKMLEQYTP